MTGLLWFLAEYGLPVAGVGLVILLMLIVATRVRDRLRPRLLHRQTTRLINQDSDRHRSPRVPSERAGVERAATVTAAAPPATSTPVGAGDSRTAPRPPGSALVGAGPAPATAPTRPQRRVGPDPAYPARRGHT